MSIVQNRKIYQPRNEHERNSDTLDRIGSFTGLIYDAQQGGREEFGIIGSDMAFLKDLPCLKEVNLTTTTDTVLGHHRGNLISGRFA